ncbi:MAG: hypothetical protein F6K14_14860 [Symploca sp. SIO2C1]|nr:hypothetical protein [Symploca sp. SIO2C1]
MGKKQFNQKIKAGRDAKVVGGNYTKTTNVNIWLMIVGVIATGSMVWLGIKFFGNFIELKRESNQEPRSLIVPLEHNLKQLV